MSMTGPGCPACDYRGRVPLSPDYPRRERPCGACSPWSHPPDFPGAALRQRAAELLADRSADPRMRAWAVGLAEYAAEVDAERERVCAPSTGRCVR